jgi:predicted esterase
MDRVSSRLRGVRAKVCVLLAVLAGFSLARPARAEPLELTTADGDPAVVIYPAQEPGPRSITVALHGMCGRPENLCRYFAEQVTRSEHLVCPRATQRCEAGGSSWPQAGFAAQIERAVQRARAVLGDRADESHGRTLVGYSLGALRALELAQRGAGQYPRVMLIGAKISPSAKLLRENGVERLLLSAGSRDMMHDHMQRESRRLLRTGFTTRFLDLGPVGHAFDPSFAQYLPEALGWLHKP